MWGAQIERVADFNRGHFVGDFPRIVGGFQVAGLESPGFLELTDVLVVDLAQWGITRTFLSTAIGRPIGV
ncbi:hypothetical protein D3C72_2142690 [compost metagenome]